MKKLYIHAHHIASHFTNGLWPVGVILLTSHMVTGKTSYESASFYCFIFSLFATPVVFFSGIVDWKMRFKGRATPIFNHKRMFGILFMVISTVVVIWRASNPMVAFPDSDMRLIYLVLTYVGLAFSVYLGHLGSKFI